jgi:ribonuclease J
LGEEGFVTITVVVDSSTGKVVGGPELYARGFTDMEDALEEVRLLVDNALGSAAAEGVGDVHALRQLVRRTVGKWVSDTYRRRPMIVPVVIEV